MVCPKNLTGKTIRECLIEGYFTPEYIQALFDKLYREIYSVSNNRGVLVFQNFTLQIHVPFAPADSWEESLSKAQLAQIAILNRGGNQSLKDMFVQTYFDSLFLTENGRVTDNSAFFRVVVSLHYDKGTFNYKVNDTRKKLVDALSQFVSIVGGANDRRFETDTLFTLSRQREPRNWVMAKADDKPEKKLARSVCEKIELGIVDEQLVNDTYDSEFLCTFERWFADSYNKVYERKMRALLRMWNVGMKRFTFLVCPESIEKGKGAGIGKTMLAKTIFRGMGYSPREIFEKANHKGRDGDLLSGYDFQPAALFDEINARDMPFECFKDFCDPFNARLTNSRYTDKALFAGAVAMVSNRTFYGLVEDYTRAVGVEDVWQIFRRIDMVFQIAPDGKITSYVIPKTNDVPPRPILDEFGNFQLFPIHGLTRNWREFNTSGLINYAIQQGYLDRKILNR